MGSQRPHSVRPWGLRGARGCPRRVCFRRQAPLLGGSCAAGGAEGAGQAGGAAGRLGILLLEACLPGFRAPTPAQQRRPSPVFPVSGPVLASAVVLTEASNPGQSAQASPCLLPAPPGLWSFDRLGPLSSEQSGVARWLRGLDCLGTWCDFCQGPLCSHSALLRGCSGRGSLRPQLDFISTSCCAEPTDLRPSSPEPQAQAGSPWLPLGPGVVTRGGLCWVSSCVSPVGAHVCVPVSRDGSRSC